MSNRPLIIAHRGASALTPENTLPAFEAALDSSDMIEFDVQITADDRLVVMHDEEVDRTTNGHGRLAELTLSQIMQLDAGSWFAPGFAGTHIPALEQATQTILTSNKPLIERKAGPAHIYVEQLHRLQIGCDVILQSFDWSFLRDIRHLAPEIELWTLGSSALTTEILLEAKDIGVSAVCWEKGQIEPAQVELARTTGMPLVVWTVDNNELPQFIKLGVDGIITNDPAFAKRTV